jgi:hypothetical protein
MLIDLGKAEMWGSNTGRNADGTVNLRSSADKTLAENDVFWVRGDGDDKATVNNFHLSKDGTGLAGRSNSANDAIMFSIDTTKLFDSSMTLAQRNALSNDYSSVYSRLTFEQNVVNTDDVELVVNYKKTDGSLVKVGSTIIADIGSTLNGGANRAEVVELKWLSKLDDPLYLFNPKIDVDLVDFVEHEHDGAIGGSPLDPLHHLCVAAPDGGPVFADGRGGLEDEEDDVGAVGCVERGGDHALVEEVGCAVDAGCVDPDDLVLARLGGHADDPVAGGLRLRCRDGDLSAHKLVEKG